MIEYREKFYVASRDLKDIAPVESRQIVSGAVAIIFAIGLFVTVVALLDQTIH